MGVSTTMWIMVAVAVIIGGGLGVYFGIRKNQDSGKIDLRKKLNGVALKDSYNSWQTLMNTQKTLDELRVADILEWANKCKATLKDDDTLFLFKATKKNIVKLGYQYTEHIDSKTNVIACVINTASGDIAHAQLFTFGEMSDKAGDLFAGYDYAVITP